MLYLVSSKFIPIIDTLYYSYTLFKLQLNNLDTLYLVSIFIFYSIKFIE